MIITLNSHLLVEITLLEEIGWRGFLQQQLKGLPKIWNILIVGILWFIWHLNFEMTTMNWLLFGYYDYLFREKKEEKRKFTCVRRFPMCIWQICGKENLKI
ncbi:MAG: CPBP family intramembrane metalloprotease [Flavobacteriaceae bacterium]|jgi:hypothetical protein|nr:CPBP family intramembrane metalloprotease [Flavobacteriaceae bacterium]